MANNILVPLDGSTLADAAIPHAVEFARRTGSGLHVVRVHAPMAPIVTDAPLVIPDPKFESDLIMIKRVWLDARVKEIRADSGLTVYADFRVGTPGEEIVAAAEACGARAIVCTTHGSGGWAPQWFGSVTDYVIRHSLRPVLAMSGPATGRTTTPKNILVLLDGSELSEAILPEVTGFAKAFGARLELFRVVGTPWIADFETVQVPEVDLFDIDGVTEQAKRELDAVAQDLRIRGLSATATVEVSNSFTATILKHIESSNPDVVALATHGRGIARLLMGSVADKVLRAGARPMLCVRPRTAPVLEHIRTFGADMTQPQSAKVS